VEFANQLKILRVQLRCTQKELAEKLGVSPGAIHKYENNQMQPTLRTVAKIENYINENKLKMNDSHIKKENEIMENLVITAQARTLELLEDKIKYLEKQLENKNSKYAKPAYHFKMESKYIAKTDEWLDTDIFGDFSMTGFTYDEMVPLMNEENDKDSWLKRYHPDSQRRLNRQTLKGVRTDYHHLTWEHMMWKAKNGQYKCYNIDLFYNRKKQKVTSLFYWVNGDKA